jgi:hypothetical protein
MDMQTEAMNSSIIPVSVDELQKERENKHKH